ncbi:MAG: hypothetical protein WBX11_14725 [Thiobacillaceae bacterium]|jgi:hypothetical protein
MIRDDSKNIHWVIFNPHCSAHRGLIDFNSRSCNFAPSGIALAVLKCVIKRHIARATMPPEGSDTIDTIAQLIMEHLKLNPLAADTVEGVANWWLRQRGLRASEEQVQKALDLLVVRQQVVCHRSLDGHLLYGRGKG